MGSALVAFQKFALLSARIAFSIWTINTMDALSTPLTAQKREFLASRRGRFRAVNIGEHISLAFEFDV